MSTRVAVLVSVLGAGALSLAACSASSPSATPTSTSTTASPAAPSSTASGSGGGGTATGSGGSADGACALLTAQEIQATTGTSFGTPTPDDSQAAAGERSCVWSATGLGGKLTVNLETGSNAIPNFNQLRTNPVGSVQTVPDLGDDAVITQGINLFVKKGNTVIEISELGIPGTAPATFLTQLGQAAIARV